MSDETLGDVFVVGATELLAPAVHWLGLQADAMTLAALDAAELAEDTGATPLPLDWTKPDQARKTLAARAGQYDMAVIWLDDEASALVRPVEEVVKKGGRVIRVHGSQIDDPIIRRLRDPDPRSDVIRQVVILAGTPGGTTASPQTQLSDIEVSGGVMAAVRDPDLAAVTVGGQTVSGSNR